MAAWMKAIFSVAGAPGCPPSPQAEARNTAARVRAIRNESLRMGSAPRRDAPTLSLGEPAVNPLSRPGKRVPISTLWELSVLYRCRLGGPSVIHFVDRV